MIMLRPFAHRRTGNPMKHALSRTCLSGLAVLGLGATMALAACSKDEDTVEAGCEPAHENVKTIKDGTLTVGAVDSVPFSSYNNGDPEGIDVEMVEQIAEDNCLNVDWEQSSYSDGIQSITGGRLDMVIGAMDRTQEREKVVDFTASTYLDGMGIASRDGYQNVRDMEAADSVGTIAGYQLVGDMKAIFGKRLKTYPSSVELKADFEAGRLDAAMDSYGNVAEPYKGIKGVTIALANKDPDPRVEGLVKTPHSAFPVTKGNDSLREAASDSINEMRKDGKTKKLLAEHSLPDDLVGTEEQMAKEYSIPED